MPGFLRACIVHSQGEMSTLAAMQWLSMCCLLRDRPVSLKLSVGQVQARQDQPGTGIT